jgi:predicted nucleotidyltransferase
MAGFEHVARAAVEIKLDSGLVVPIIPLPLYGLLKLVAYSDRKFEKDVVAVEHVLRHYQEDDDCRWGLEHGESLVDVDHSTAYLLGLDGKEFLSDELKAAVLPVFDKLADDEENDDDDDDWRPSRVRLFL